MTLTGYVFRRVFRSPGFSGMVVATIALGIGINLGIFSIAKAIFLNSLGVPDADRLVYYSLGTGQDIQLKFSTEQYEALRSMIGNDILAWQSQRFVLQTPETAVDGALVTGNTFSVLRLKPFMGRFFGGADDVPGGGQDGWTAVVGYSFWKTHWGNSNVVGQTITLNGILVRIVGVLPREFSGIESLGGADILLPRNFGRAAGLELAGFGNALFISPEWLVMGRLPNGASIDQVQAKLKTIESSFRRAANLLGPAALFFPNTAPGSLLSVHDGRMGVTLEFRALRSPVILLEVLAGAVLLFCACNLVLLFISRSRREAHATAMRLVLGARLSDQVRLATVEAAVVAGMGCVLAAPMAWGTARGLSLAIQSAPGFSTFPTVSPNNALLFASVGIALAIACLTGIVGSIWLGRNRVAIRLKEVGTTVSSRSRGWIVGLEVFASILLMTAAATSLLGFQTLSHHSGFDGNAVMVRTPLSIFVVASELDRFVNQIRSSPEVQAVGTTSLLPMSGSSSRQMAEVYGANGSVRQLYVWSVSVSSLYFSAIGTSIVMGRDFTRDDLAGDPVCVLSSKAASGLFPGETPLGKYLQSPACRVVGVAENAHFRSVSEPDDPIVYQLSRREAPYLIVKAASSTLAIQAAHSALQKFGVQAVGPDEAFSLSTIQSHIDKDLRLWKVITLAGTFCAFLASIILAVGFFGILSLQVVERQREIGIRIALGADATRVSVALVKKLSPAAAVGLALGSAAAFVAAARIAEVYHLTAQLVIAGYLGSLVLLAFLMLLAAAVPLRRALAVSPVECLAAE